jgi:hypothetical protein
LEKFTKNFVPVISSFLIERFEYDIEVVDNGDLSLIDEASREKTSDPLLKIPLANIETVTVISEPTKHLMSRKNNLLLEIVFRYNKENNGHAIQNKRCIRFDLDDKYVNILQAQINLLKDVKNNLRVQNAIALLKDPKLCNACAKRR